MSSIIIVSINQQDGRQLASVLAPGLDFDEIYGELLEVHRDVTIKPGIDPQMHLLKGHPLNGESSQMECDGGDTTYGVDMSEGASNRKWKPYKAKNLTKKKSKSNLKTVSSENSDEDILVDENFEKHVDIYIYYPSGNLELDPKIAKSFIPKGVIVALNGCDRDKGNIIKELMSRSDGSTLLFVTTDNDITNCKSKKNRRGYELCTRYNLRNSVCKILQKYTQCYRESPLADCDSMFVQEETLSNESVNVLNGLKTEKKILRVTSGRKTYFCPKPEELINLLARTPDYKDEERKLTSEMNKEQERVLLDALVDLDLILRGTNSDIYIKHLFNTDSLRVDDIRSLNISPKHNALLLSSGGTVNKTEILIACEILSWKITRAHNESNNNNIDCFLLRKRDSITVLMWFADSRNETNIYLCVINGNRDIDTLSDRQRDDLHSLRCDIKERLGDSTKTSICILYNGEVDVPVACAFVEDSSEGEHCKWIGSDDRKLFYKEDALALFRIWISPSEEDRIQNALNAELNDSAIAKLCRIFRGDYELFFLEEGIPSEEIDNIKMNPRLSILQQIQQMITTWKSHHSENVSLFDLRNAIKKSFHNPVDLSRFDAHVQNILDGRNTVSLI